MVIRNAVVKIIATFFYIGYLPLVPGTFGSLAGVFLYAGIIRHEALFFTIILVAVGFLVSGSAEKILGRKDSRHIVIDEVVGMQVALVYLPYDFKVMAIAFIIFRILDALKPYPAYKLERLKGSLGIMSDDLIAGLYTNMILQIALRIVSFKAS
ncbi:MAG: phosphatidylglycerophosphatase A [Candidatus Omnitrophica bacterium]|nr:phosphatidylglycerophosphatase A [Candidatus Omnitrophota bacterium]